MSHSQPPMDRSSSQLPQTTIDLTGLPSGSESSSSEDEVHTTNSNNNDNAPSSDTLQLFSPAPTTPEARRTQYTRTIRNQLARNRALIQSRTGQRSHSLPPPLLNPISSPEPDPNQENIPPLLSTPGHLLHRSIDVRISSRRYPSSPGESPPEEEGDVVYFGRQVPRIPLAPLYHSTLVHGSEDSMSEAETVFEGSGDWFSTVSGSGSEGSRKRGRKRDREGEAGSAMKRTKLDQETVHLSEFEGDTLVNDEDEDVSGAVAFHDILWNSPPQKRTRAQRQTHPSPINPSYESGEFHSEEMNSWDEMYNHLSSKFGALQNTIVEVKKADAAATLFNDDIKKKKKELAELALNISNQFEHLEPLAAVLLTDEQLKVAKAKLELAELARWGGQFEELREGLVEQKKKIEAWDKILVEE